MKRCVRVQFSFALLSLALACVFGAPCSGAEVAEGKDETVTAAPAKSPSATPQAILFTGKPGRFEVIAVDGAWGQFTLDLSEQVWRQLDGVFALPRNGFGSAIVVKLFPANLWKWPEPAKIWLEPAGRVTLGIKFEAPLEKDAIVRFLVRALLVRQSLRDESEIPLWLESGAARFVTTRQRPSLHDQWQQELADVAPLPLLTVLNWGRGQTPPGFEACAYGAFLWLREIGRNGGRWDPFFRQQLAGQNPAESLAVFVEAQPWKTLDDVELAWEVALQDMRLQTFLPVFSIGISRERVQDWSRVRLHDKKVGRDVLLTPEDLWTSRREPVVRAFVDKRRAAIEGQLGLIHPFFRNPANSLGRFFWLLDKGSSRAKVLAAWAQFRADLADAEHLAAASKTLLDAQEAGAARTAQ